MSSTNRGKDRAELDYYVTPVKEVKNFLNEWLLDMPDDSVSQRPDRTQWLDPCSGGDSVNGMSYADTIKEAFQPEVLDTIDIRQDSRASLKQDFLLTPTKGYDVIITNPPFKLALPIIKKAIAEVNEGGYVVMLLRLNFLEGKERKSFFEENMPERIYVHHKRMSFTDDKKTDSVAYAHFVWKKGYDKNYSLIKII